MPPPRGTIHAGSFLRQTCPNPPFCKAGLELSSGELWDLQSMRPPQAFRGGLCRGSCGLCTPFLITDLLQAVTGSPHLTCSALSDITYKAGECAL